MRRLILIALTVAIVPWIVIGIVREATDDDTQDFYFVRAVFDNASTVVNGEDVKVAGVAVGQVTDMNVTDENKAAVTLRIDDEDFTPWKQDASCTIRSQGLIGEKFLECEPGSTGAENLNSVDEGDGKGEHLLPVENTSSPVDLDLLNDIMRRPYRERLSILLDEFGTALAGRGGDLNEVIHRANPALRETDDVIKILADQNRDLARLAKNSDTVLAPLARERERFADFIVQANATGEASAERREDIRRGIALLPDFLRQLRPLMADLEGFSDQGIPLLANLDRAAPALGRLIKAQGTISTAGRESFPSLGDALERGRPALIRSEPLFKDLTNLGTQFGPTSKSLDELTKSLDETGGVQRLNDFLYTLALSTNGFDNFGHYLRAGLVTNLCSTYAVEPGSGCNANFYDPASAALAPTSELAKFSKATRAKGGDTVLPGTLLNGLLGTGADAGSGAAREQNLAALRQRAEGQSPALKGAEPALDYLLGNDE